MKVVGSHGGLYFFQVLRIQWVFATFFSHCLDAFPMASLRVVAVSGETLQTFPLERLEASASKGFGVDAQIVFCRLAVFFLV